MGDIQSSMGDQSNPFNPQGNPNGQGKPKKRRDKSVLAPMKQTKSKTQREQRDKIPDFGPKARCLLRQHKLEMVYDLLALEKEFVEDQQIQVANLRDEQFKAIETLRGDTLEIGTLKEMITTDKAIIETNTAPAQYVSIASFVDRTLLEPGCTVLLKGTSSHVVGVLNNDEDPMVNIMRVEKAPKETFADIGGLEEQIREVKETVELPLTHPELFVEMGITAPKGCILYGPPGTGKTLLAKAVANSTSAAFLRVTGSELVQKYGGEGPRLVREIFKCAADLAPAIIFIDEIDAIGSKRYEAHSGGEREIQRTMLELLNQLDGFDERTGVRVIMATNMIESLDPALIRPGRIDRKIELPLPDEETRKQIFRIHMGNMTLTDDVKEGIGELISTKDDLSGADIKAICTEAGMLALRDRRTRVTMKDFKRAREKVLFKKEEDVPDIYT